MAARNHTRKKGQIKYLTGVALCSGLILIACSSEEGDPMHPYAGRLCHDDCDGCVAYRKGIAGRDGTTPECAPDGSRSIYVQLSDADRCPPPDECAFYCTAYCASLSESSDGGGTDDCEAACNVNHEACTDGCQGPIVNQCLGMCAMTRDVCRLGCETGSS